MSIIKRINGRGIMEGMASGPALIGEAIQGNGALNYSTGEIIQVGHSLKGKKLTGGVLIISGARGSTAWSVRLHTTLINGVGPCAMIFPKMDSRTAGATASMKIPVVTDLEEDVFKYIKLGDIVTVNGTDGYIEISSKG
jgi:uncharacterized protein